MEETSDKTITMHDFVSYYRELRPQKFVSVRNLGRIEFGVINYSSKSLSKLSLLRQRLS